MRNRSGASGAGIVGAALALAIATAGWAGAKSTLESYSGKVVSIDANRKTMVVGCKDGEKTLKLTDKAQYDLRVEVAVEDLPTDHWAHVFGKVVEETAAVESRAIIVPPRRYGKMENIGKSSVAGVLAWEGDRLYVTAKGKRFAVTLSKNIVCQTTEPIAVSDIEPGDRVDGDAKRQNGELIVNRVIVAARKK